MPLGGLALAIPEEFEAKLPNLKARGFPPDPDIADSDAGGSTRDRRLVHLCLGQVLPGPTHRFPGVPLSDWSH
jgi:hypothetical protein